MSCSTTMMVSRVDLFQQFGGLMGLDVVIRRPARRQKAISDPAPAASRFRAIASGRATGSPPGGCAHPSGEWFPAHARCVRIRPWSPAETAYLDPVIDIERQQQIVFDVWLSNRRLLEFPADPELGYPGFVEPRQVGDAVEQHSPSSGLVLPVIYPSSWSASAVRTDDGAFRRRKRQRQIIDGVKPSNENVHAVQIGSGGSGAGSKTLITHSAGFVR